MAICVAPFRTLSSSLLRSGAAAAPAALASSKAAILGYPSALRSSLKHSRTSSNSYSGGGMSFSAQAAANGENLNLNVGFGMVKICIGMLGL